jgi:hypothetical protein
VRCADLGHLGLADLGLRREPIAFGLLRRPMATAGSMPCPVSTALTEAGVGSGTPSASARSLPAAAPSGQEVEDHGQAFPLVR